MKTYYKLLFSLILAGITMFLQVALYAQQDMESSNSDFSLRIAPPPTDLQKFINDKPDLTDGSLGYANNVWTNDFFSFDTDDPMSVSVIGKISIQSASGDFHPDDPDHVFMIDINENYLRKVEISSAQTIDSVFVAVPVQGGIWSVLSIHKTSGAFYGVATNGSASNVYEINPATGNTTLVFETGLPAVISGTFDNAGLLWLLEIKNDNTYKLNINTLNLELVGDAGFDADSPQGMGYDALEDQVYFAAYVKNVGPQLRLLNRTTGETSFIGNLPGETTAFGFPGSMPLVEHTIQIPAGWSGISSYIIPQNTDLVNLLVPISDEFILLKNEAGDIYWPQENIFTLQTWTATEGYIINMNQPASLIISGYPVGSNFLDFSSGWNILAVMSPDEIPVDELLGDIDGFVMAKEIAGTGIYWPEYQINTLGNVVPGKAYQIYSTQDITVEP